MDASYDISKSVDRYIVKFRGLMPTLTTNSKAFCFAANIILDGPMMLASHGFPVEQMELGGLRSISAYGLLAGNCMSLPVVGALQAAALAVLDFGDERAHWRAPGTVCTLPVQVPGLSVECSSDPDGSD